MQPVEAAGGKEARDRVGAALDQNTAKAARGEGGEDRRRCEPTLVGGERDHLDLGRELGRRAGGGDHKPPDAVGRQRPCARRQSSIGIEDHPRRARARHPPNRQLRIVGDRRAHPDHHRVDQGAQAMQMGKPGLAVDVVRVSGRGGDAGIDRLSALPDDDEVVDRALPQRPENVLPRPGQGTGGVSKRFRNGRPRGVGAAVSMAECIPNRLGNASIRHRRIPAFGADCGVP